MYPVFRVHAVRVRGSSPVESTVFEVIVSLKTFQSRHQSHRGNLVNVLEQVLVFEGTSKTGPEVNVC